MTAPSGFIEGHERDVTVMAGGHVVEASSELVGPIATLMAGASAPARCLMEPGMTCSDELSIAC